MPHSSWGEPGLSRTVKVPVPGGGIQLNVHPELEVIFKELVRRLHEARVRHGRGSLTSAGGYHKRKISGTDRWSNHSWGGAGDFNAPANPYSRNGVTDFPVDETRRIARDLGFRWGWDYTGKKDAMHFEYLGSRRDAAALTARLLAPPPAPAAPTDPEGFLMALNPAQQQELYNLLTTLDDDRAIAGQRHDQLLEHLAADRVTATNTEAELAAQGQTLRAIEGLLTRLVEQGGA